ncbi:hypothetical protein LJR074_003436 [Acidovorax sp. LjRoot74]|uniref:hypothetical protein n=1 Tax=Acidovorax sp. LjRoot74 TaxID=3342337 RepID=UPI003ECEF8EE
MLDQIDEAGKKLFLKMIQDSLFNAKTDADDLYRHLDASSREKETTKAHLLGLANEMRTKGFSIELPLQGSNNIKEGLITQIAIAELLADQFIEASFSEPDLEWLMLGAWQVQACLKKAAGSCLGLQLKIADISAIEKTLKARKAANARHDRAGGSREKAQKIRDIWASGKYTNRDRCAEEECGALNMSYSSARKALINRPAPR